MSKKCTKRKHDTSGKARYEAGRRAELYGVPYNHYFCDVCGGWHIGRAFKEKVIRIVKKRLMKNPAVLGIDPGRTGAMCLLHGKTTTGMPRVEIHDFDGILVANEAIRSLNERLQIKFAIIEKVWLRDKERDNKTAEVLIRNAQAWETILIINKIPYETYSPATWRKGFIPKTLQHKNGYIKKARSLFPEYENLFDRHDRAEAALIAYRALRHVQAGMPVEL